MIQCNTLKKHHCGSYLVHVEGYRRDLNKVRAPSSVRWPSTTLIYESYGGKGLINLSSCHFLLLLALILFVVWFVLFPYFVCFCVASLSVVFVLTVFCQHRPPRLTRKFSLMQEFNRIPFSLSPFPPPSLLRKVYIYIYTSTTCV